MHATTTDRFMPIGVRNGSPSSGSNALPANKKIRRPIAILLHPPPERGPQRSLGQGRSADPNDKLTVGIGEQGFVRAGDTLTYTIRFENMATATLPAQEIRVTDRLSTKLDWSTIELVAIGFNNVEFDLASGLREFDGRIEVPTDPFPVDATVRFDSTTGELAWYMRSIDTRIGDFPKSPTLVSCRPMMQHIAVRGLWCSVSR